MRKLGCFMGPTSPKTGDEKAPGLRVGLLSQTDHSFIWFCSAAVGCGRVFFRFSEAHARPHRSWVE